MNRRNDTASLSAAAQEYLLTLRVMAGDGSHVKAAQVARRMGVTTQAASEMFRRLGSDGLVNQSDGRELVLTGAGRAAADAIFRRHALVEWLLTLGRRARLGGVRRGGGPAPGRDLAAGRGPPRRDAGPSRRPVPHGNPIDAETARRRPKGTPLSEIEAGQRATIYRITEEAEEDAGPALVPRGAGPHAGRPRHGPRPLGVARLADARGARAAGRRSGLRPASLVHVLPGEADPALFHRVPGAPAGPA